MSYLSLYRKWRPQTFNEVAGQPHVVQTLKNAVDKGRVSHAYLFCGPRGTGKTTTARILAKAINCEHGPTSTPCNNCESCRSVNDGSSIDVLELDAASNRKVEEIRELLERIPYSSTQSRKKVYIIDEVHMLTPESFNTLLKTLEEPPEHVIFLLATTEPHKVLPTILSRCQRFDFRRIPVSDIEARLREVADNEEIDIEDGALSLIANHAHGALRDPLGTLEQLTSYKQGKITSSDVISLLGLTDSELLFNFTDILGRGALAEGLLFIDDLAGRGIDLRQFMQDHLRYLRDLFLVQNVPDARPGGVSGGLWGKFTEQASLIDPKILVFFINTLNDVFNQSRWATDIRLLFELALFKLAKAGDDASIEGVLRRLERLESITSSGSVAYAGVTESRPVDSGVRGPRSANDASPAAKPQPKELGRQNNKEHPSPSRTLSAGAGVKKDQAASVALAEPPTGGGVSLEAVQKVWPQVLKIIKEKKRSRYSFFASANLSRIDDSGRLVLSLKESDKQFIESPENLKLIQGVLKVASGLNLQIICESAKEQVKTVAVTDAGMQDGDIMGADDYIKLVQDTFGAKIVQEIPIDKI